MADWDEGKLRDLILQALDSVKAERRRLRLSDIGEWALVFRVGHHLASLVEQDKTNEAELTVDSEYNINFEGNPKRLAVHEQLRRRAEVLGRTIGGGHVRVRPDLIIHSRNWDNYNLAVIEVKYQDAGGDDTAYAVEKLQAYCGEPFLYRFGVLLRLPRDWSRFREDAIIDVFAQRIS